MAIMMIMEFVDCAIVPASLALLALLMLAIHVVSIEFSFHHILALVQLAFIKSQIIAYLAI
jgi:hypothetical protein